MTVHREDHLVSFECDGCDELTGGEIEDFQRAWNEAKSEGWRTEKVDGQWLHLCPTCQRRP